MNIKSLREQVFKLLFRAGFVEPSEMPSQVEYFLDSGDMTVNDKDRSYIMEKCSSIVEKIPEIDGILNDRMDGWTTERISRVELAILRLGTYEVLYDEAVPAGVAINEAVELAKKYGEDKSGSFVNGVLAGVNDSSRASARSEDKKPDKGHLSGTVSEKKGDTYITRKL